MTSRHRRQAAAMARDGYTPINEVAIAPVHEATICCTGEMAVAEIARWTASASSHPVSGRSSPDMAAWRAQRTKSSSAPHACPLHRTGGQETLRTRHEQPCHLVSGHAVRTSRRGACVLPRGIVGGQGRSFR